MKLLYLATCFLMLAACDAKTRADDPSPHDVELFFTSHKKVLNQIKQSIIQDIGEENHLKIGEDDSKVDSMETRKHKQYLADLNFISVESMYILLDSDGTEVTFNIYASGMVFGGCVTQITHMSRGKPFRPEWAEPYFLVDLQNGWYGHQKCN